jgi:Spy/CpxP family protein refolding chaperone
MLLTGVLGVVTRIAPGQNGTGVPTAEEQMKLFTTRLDLSNAQQAKVKPILDDLHDATVKLVEDRSLSQEERAQQVGAWRIKTDKRMREVLSEEQRSKLDQVEREPHPELHGSVDGTAPQK